jgi:hypothetical protein
MGRGSGNLGTVLGAIAVVIAIVALVLNLVIPGPTGATGATGATGTTGTTGSQGPPGAAATKLWAVVYANGTLDNGSNTNATTTSSEGTGDYQVVFDQNVRDCAYIGTLGIPGSTGGGSQSAGFLTTAGRADNPYGVWVETFDSAGTLTDEPFSLVVFC